MKEKSCLHVEIMRLWGQESQERGTRKAEDGAGGSSWDSTKAALYSNHIKYYIVSHGFIQHNVMFILFCLAHTFCNHNRTLHNVVFSWQDVSHDDIPIMLVGNKCDLRQHAVNSVPTSYGEKLAMVITEKRTHRTVHTMTLQSFLIPVK